MIHLPVTQNKPAYNHLDLCVHMLRAKNSLGAQGERSAVFLSVCGNMLQRMRRDIGVYLNSAGYLAFLWVLNGRSASSLELDSELCHSEHVTWHFQDEHATRQSMHTWRAHMSLPGKGYCFWEIPLGVSFDCPLLVNDASRTPTPPPTPPPPPSLMHVTFTLIPGKQRKRQEVGYFWGCHWHWTWPNSLQPRYQFLITNGFADVPLRIENLFTAMPVIDTVKGRKARKTTAFQELQKKKSWIILNQRICFFTLFHMIKKL